MLKPEKRTQSANDREPAARHAADGERVLHQFLVQQMRKLLSTPGRTKRTAVRLALAAAIREGHLRPGSTVPPEIALTRILNVSLGTVQVALRQLQQTGTIVRRRGDGSRVASIEPLSNDVWHFRFLSKATQLPLRFVEQKVAINRTVGDGAWSVFLGPADGYVRIQRSMTMSDQSELFAEMYLIESSVDGLLRTDPEELDMINIRPYLEETFDLRVARARHTVQTICLDNERALSFGLPAANVYFEIHARAYSSEGEPVYFQRIYVDSSRYILDF